MVTVVVPSHARPQRLEVLLDALAKQSIASERFEVLVVHDYERTESFALFAHVAGAVRHIPIPAGTGSPARQRNLGWRAARAPLIAFTDDDCRPDERWLERLLQAAERHPGAIVQGATRPDPLEAAALAEPYFRTLTVDPPGPFAQTCNILYPRTLLEAVDGFDEAFTAPSGEDTDLAWRARKAGAAYVGVPDALVFHAVEAYSLSGMIRLNRKWEHLALLAKRHPEVRRTYALGLFWRLTHFHLSLALLGLGLARRHPYAAVLALPYLRAALSERPAGELPGRALVDLLEVATLLRGSVRYRTLVV